MMMEILWPIIILILMVSIPRLMVVLAAKIKLFKILGPVFLCYLTGFLLSFILPSSSLAMQISEILVPIAIPLILFTADLASIRRLAWTALLSFILVAASVSLVATAAFFAFKDQFAIAAKLSGMMVGLYTGGTPNLMAIGLALGVSETDIVLANTSDMVVGGIYFFMLLTVMPRLVHRFLPAAGGIRGAEPTLAQDPALAAHLAAEYVPEKLPFSLRASLRRTPAVILAAGCLAVAAGLAMLITGRLDVMIIMLIVTVFGIGLSFVKKVRATPGSFAMGQYLIYMFSFGIGLSFKTSDLSARTLLLLAFFALVQFGAIILHLLLSKLFHIEGSIALITSTAGIYGPAFIIPVAQALKNREVVLPGLICGILGYAAGNFLGIGTALLLGFF